MNRFYVLSVTFLVVLAAFIIAGGLLIGIDFIWLLSGFVLLLAGLTSHIVAFLAGMFVSERFIGKGGKMVSEVGGTESKFVEALGKMGVEIAKQKTSQEKMIARREEIFTIPQIMIEE